MRCRVRATVRIGIRARDTVRVRIAARVRGTLPGQQHEYSKLLPGGHALAVRVSVRVGVRVRSRVRVRVRVRVRASTP